MGYMTKNYATSEKLTIGGELAIEGDGKITKDGVEISLGGGTTINVATKTTNGTVKQAAAQADSVATDVTGLVADYNGLLAKLRAAGILSTT